MLVCGDREFEWRDIEEDYILEADAIEDWRKNWQVDRYVVKAKGLDKRVYRLEAEAVWSIKIAIVIRECN